MENFTASRGWSERFKRHRNLHSVKITGETASADMQAADEFSINLQAITERRNYPTRLVFNGDETGLFWKRMPSRTFIASEEKSASGFKAAKDRLTLLLGGNATAHFKLKPLFVYHSKTPQAMKGFCKTTLPVIWRSNRKAWMTRDIFSDLVCA